MSLPAPSHTPDLPDDTVTPKEAARLLSCTVHTVYRALDLGLLKGHRLNGSSRARRRVYAWSVAQYQRSREDETESPDQDGQRDRRSAPRRARSHKAHADAMSYLSDAGIL